MDRPPSDAIFELLAPYPAAVVEDMLTVREMILALAPNANETIYDGSYAVVLLYSFTTKSSGAFCHVPAYAKHVNLGFNQGALLSDPDGRLEGDGSTIRHVRASASVCIDDYVIDLVRQAIALKGTPSDGQGLSEVVVARGPKKRPSAL